MLEVTHLGVRLAAMIGSAALHAGVVFALTGHAPESRAPRPSAPVQFELALAPPPETTPQPVEATPVRTSPSASVVLPRPHHRHDYPVPADHDARPHDPSHLHVAAPLPAPPEVVESAPALAAAMAPRFVMQVQRQASAQAADLHAHSHASDSSGEGLAHEPMADADVDSPARLVSGGTPDYPFEARAAGIEADIPLEIVVSASGRVTSARVLRTAGFGLDAAALAGIRGYVFTPAVRQGRATSVRMKWTVVFRLQ